jgi:eukaryotic-like serine/threonine-protein kinase
MPLCAEPRHGLPNRARASMRRDCWRAPKNLRIFEDYMDPRGARSQPAPALPKQGGAGASTQEVAVGSPRVQAGQLVGRYRLLFPIAAGGMAEVWAAKPDGGGFARAVAIKLVRPEFAVDAEYARMFVDEAVVASAIRHPNICETYELGREDNLLFMVLEWVAGDSLSGLLRGSELKPLPDEIAARICAEACAGLHAAHEASDAEGNPLGVVHRDVSPPNILVSIHGQVKVSDFGIAKAKNQLHARTRTGEIKGKLAYIPPEQVLGHGVDRRVDIYAMGCVLYVSTLGLRPFGSGAKALGNIVRGSYLKPRELRADYPEELERIVARALAANRQERYQTAEEMRFELEQWLLTRPHPTQHGDVARVVRERLSDERKKMIDVLFNAGRSIPEAMAKRFLVHNEKTATPTATSGIVLQPPGLARKPAQVTETQAATARPPAKQVADAPRPSIIARGEAVTVPPTAAPVEQITARPSAKPSKEIVNAPADAVPESGPSDEPTLLAAPGSEANAEPARLAAPLAIAPPTGPQLPSAPSASTELTEILLRRMKPSALPFALALALAVFALLWFALAHR